MRRRLLLQLLPLVAIAGAIAGGAYVAFHTFLHGFDALAVERELRGKLQSDRLLQRIIASSRESIAGGRKLDPAVLDELRKKEWHFEFPIRLKAGDEDCIEFWFGAADQHWGLIITAPNTKPRGW